MIFSWGTVYRSFANNERLITFHLGPTVFTAKIDEDELTTMMAIIPSDTELKKENKDGKE